MSAPTTTARGAETASAPRTVRVWDPLVRVFHWTLVGSVGIAMLLEAGTWLHRTAGYVVVGLVAFRLVWGVVGGRHARFGDFVRGPRAIMAYLRGLTSGDAPHYRGHNPAGGAMILALLTVLALVAGTGAVLDTDAFWGNETLEKTHEILANALYALVPLHVLGAVVSSVLHRENLVLAMITGNKKA